MALYAVTLRIGPVADERLANAGSVSGSTVATLWLFCAGELCAATWLISAVVGLADSAVNSLTGSLFEVVGELSMLTVLCSGSVASFCHAASDIKLKRVYTPSTSAQIIKTYFMMLRINRVASRN